MFLQTPELRFAPSADELAIGDAFWFAYTWSHDAFVSERITTKSNCDRKFFRKFSSGDKSVIV